MEQTILVAGMKCDGCVTIVKEKFEGIAEITSVAVNLANKEAVITSQKKLATSLLKEALADTKFTVID